VRVVSTRDPQRITGFREAILEGLPPDGGLFLPDGVAPLTTGELSELVGREFVDVALAIARRYVGDELDPQVLEEVVRSSLDFDIPLTPLGDGDTYFLELFHGPTGAFKDVGARFLARCMAALVPTQDRKRTVLVATSGDTGGAVARAFHQLPGIEVVVLFPDGQVSGFQRRQFSTLGGNVRSVSVSGTFDDCQRLAKQAFADDSLRMSEGLTSANSINIGRLIPQVFFAYAWATVAAEGGQRPIVLSVPSGNFGNLTAGVMARRLGIPISRFIAATNANRVVPDYLSTGEYRPRVSIRTLSNAMDVGSPSNFDRLLSIYGNDAEAMRSDIEGSVHTDAETVEAIQSLHRHHDRLVDPHTAVAWQGWRARRRPSEIGVVLATAHPMKFSEVIEQAIGAHPFAPDDGASNAEVLVPLEDPALARLREVLDWG
jgi:threonine synthase